MSFTRLEVVLLLGLALTVLLGGIVLMRLKSTVSEMDVDLARSRRERDRVRAALEGSSIALWDWDITADALWLDEGWSAMLGDAARETRSSTAQLVEAIHPQDVSRLRTALADVLSGRADRYDVEHRVRAADGSWRWIRTRGNVTARDGRGRAIRASGTNADVTPRKRAERSLAESEARFRALSELSSDLYWEQDEQFRLVTWSAPAWARQRDPSLPRPALEAPELTEADWSAHREVLEARKAFRDLEVRQVTEDGREAWLSVGAFPITDEHGTFAGYRGLARIITDRKLAERRLRESESQFRQLVEFMPAAMVLVDRDRRVVVHNKAYGELLGLPADSIHGAKVRDILGEERYGVVGPYLEGAFAGEPGHYEARRVDAAGQARDLDVLHWPLRGPEGDIAGVIMLGIDVTRLKEADRMKDHFVSVVSHELRTPLTAMRGSLGLLAAGVVGDLPDEAKSMVDIALQNSDRLWRLVNDLLDIEKMSAGQLQFRVADLDWGPLVREAVDSSRGLAQQFDVSFETSVPDGLHVAGDADRLTQVLANLILNAAKFSPAGGVVEVSASRVAGRRIRTDIRDHGPGIPDEFRSRIFKPFQQAESGDARKSVGTGLGLAISREIVERLGGAIGFDDAAGGGTVFWFELPEADGTPPTP